MKLIDRINSHEKVLDNSFDRITDSGERRTEKLMFKIEENGSGINWLKGKLDNK